MIRLPYTGTYSLELVTAQNGAQVLVCYSDETSTGYTGGVQVTAITSATTTAICSTPAAATTRDIDEINIKNTYAGSHTIVVQIDAAATNYPLLAVALLENESLNYTHGSGWQCIDANGNLKVSPTNSISALLVTNTPAGDIASTTVQAALNELDTEKMAITNYDSNADGVVDLAYTLVFTCRNSTGSTITKGSIVYITGATGQVPTVALAKADAETTSSKTIGMVTADILNNATGYAAMRGSLSGYDTSAFADGTTLWLSATVAGGMTTTRPVAPNHAVLIGFTAYSHATLGKIALYINNGWELDELHDVLITSVANNEILQYNSASGVWKNVTNLTLPGRFYLLRHLPV